MVKINEHFLTMKKNYLFIDIAKKIKAYSAAHPDKPLIRMGIGDVTLPLAPVVVEAIKKGADEMGVKETFKGYEDSGTGYDFLKQAIADYYKSFGVSLELSEIRVNDGAKADCALKISTCVNAACQAAAMGTRGVRVQSTDGIVEENVERTLDNFAILSTHGTSASVILDLMLNKEHTPDAE